MIRNIYFDLDGTLISFPSPRHRFLMALYSGKCLKHHFGSDLGIVGFSRAVLRGQKRVLLERQSDEWRSHSETVNEIWIRYIAHELESTCSLPREQIEHKIRVAQDEFYSIEFPKVCKAVKTFHRMCELVQRCRVLGLSVCLTTNPLSRLEGIRERLHSSGLVDSHFTIVTHAEKMHFLKPGASYYREVLNQTGHCAEETLMIGNDPVKDAAAQKVGIKTLIVTPQRSESLAVSRVLQCLGQ